MGTGKELCFFKKKSRKKFQHGLCFLMIKVLCPPLRLSGPWAVIFLAASLFFCLCCLTGLPFLLWTWSRGTTTLARRSTLLLQKVTPLNSSLFLLQHGLWHLCKNQKSSLQHCRCFDTHLFPCCFYLSGHQEAVMFLTEICKVNPHGKDR